MWYQQTLTLNEKPRGFHLVTDEIPGRRVVATLQGDD